MMFSRFVQLNRQAIQRRKRLATTCVAVGVAGMMSSLAHADISSTLTGLGATNADVPVNHGSTAETILTWDTNWDQYSDWNGRGDVYQIDRIMASVLFVPVAGNIRVAINEFVLDEWGGGGDTSSRWSVNGSVSGAMASGNWNDFNTAHDPQDFGGRSVVHVAALGLPGESLTLAFEHDGTGTISYLAMDNLAFSSTVVPEPALASMAWLGVTGLGALAMRRKKL